MQLPVWIEEEPAHIRDLLIELHQVRRRGMRGLETSAAIPTLVTLASTRSQKTSQLSQRKLMTVLLGEVLPKHLELTQDQAGLPLYFGLAQETWNKTEAQRRERVATEVFHQGLSTFRRPDTGAERPFLLRLAEALYSLAQPLPRLEPFQNYGTPYIDRTKYHNRFDALLSQGAKLIAFEGEPGNGKTRLADELVAERMRQGDTRVFLDASDELRLKVSVALALQEHTGYQLENHGSDDDVYVRAFATYVCSIEAPTYVLIDNLDDSRLLDTLVPTATRSTVIITSRQQLLPAGRGESITVNEMETDEARLLIKMLVPSVLDHELEWLARTLGNKPLAIDHACTGLLADGFMAVQDFCSAVHRRAAAVMKQAWTPVEQSLSFVYENILDRLQQSQQKHGIKARSLLELIAVFASEAIPGDLLRSTLALTSPPEDPTLVTVEFQAAQKELQRLHLVTYSANGFSIHKFTQAILRDILRETEAKYCLILHRMFAEKLADHKPGDAFEESVLDLLPHLRSVLLGLSTTELTPQDSKDVARTVSILAQGMRQVGDVYELAEFARRFFAIQGRTRDGEGTRSTLNERSASLFIEDAYRAGLIPRSEYVAIMLHMLKYEYNSPSDIELDSYGGIRLLEIILLTYNSDVFEDLLEGYRRKPQKKGKLGASWRGDILRLTGDLQASQARWEKSFTSYRRALKMYDLDLENLNCLRGRLATLLSIADTSIEAGDFRLTKENVRSAGDLIMTHKERIMDSSILARMERVATRAMTIELVNHVALGGEVSQGGTYRHDAFKMAFQHHEAAGMHRLLLQVNYYWGCYRLLHDDVASAQILFGANAKKSRELGELDTALMYHLGLIKLKIFEGGLNLRDISRCVRIGAKFLNTCQRPAQYADAVGTAFVVGAMCNAPQHVVLSLRESAHEAHAAVGKHWKFEVLDRIVSKELSLFAILLP